MTMVLIEPLTRANRIRLFSSSHECSEPKNTREKNLFRFQIGWLIWKTFSVSIQLQSVFFFYRRMKKKAEQKVAFMHDSYAIDVRFPFTRPTKNKKWKKGECFKVCSARMLKPTIRQYFSLRIRAAEQKVCFKFFDNFWATLCDDFFLVDMFMFKTTLWIVSTENIIARLSSTTRWSDRRAKKKNRRKNS